MLDQVETLVKSSPGLSPGEGDRPQDGGGVSFHTATDCLAIRLR
jgi:hypothetical protein